MVDYWPMVINVLHNGQGHAVGGQSPIMEHVMDLKESIGSRAFKLSVEVTEKTTDAQVSALLAEACTEFVGTNGIVARFQLVIGRLLVVVRDRKIFKEKYKTFDRYMIAEVVDKYGISRATVWTGLQIAQAVPEISVDQATDIGVVKMRDIARTVRHEQDKLVQAADKAKLLDKLVKQAPKHTVPEFRKWLEAGNLLTPRTSPQRLTTIVVRGTPELVEQWNALVGDRAPAEVLAEIIARRHPARMAARKHAA